MKELTQRQIQLHAFLCARWADPPTVREMGAHLGVTLNAVMGHLRALAQKGYIAKPDACRSRGIQLLIGPDLNGSTIEVAGRTYTLTEETHAGSVSKD